MARGRRPRKIRYRKPRKYRRTRKHHKTFRKKGTYCDFCGKRIYDMPFECKRCNSLFCGNHRLPESHNCRGLKVKKWPPEHTPPQEPSGPKPPDKPRKPWKPRGPRIRIGFNRLSTKVRLLIIFVVLSILLSFASWYIDLPYLVTVSWLFVYLAELIVLYSILRYVDGIGTHSTLRIWSLRLLSGIFILAGIFFIVLFGFASAMILNSYMLWFSCIFGLGLILIGFYLSFKFKTRSGIIVWHGA